MSFASYTGRRTQLRVSFSLFLPGPFFYPSVSIRNVPYTSGGEGVACPPGCVCRFFALACGGMGSVGFDCKGVGRFLLLTHVCLLVFTRAPVTTRLSVDDSASWGIALFNSVVFITTGSTVVAGFSKFMKTMHALIDLDYYYYRLALAPARSADDKRRNPHRGEYHLVRVTC